MKVISVLILMIIIVSCNPYNEYNRGYWLEQDTEIGDIIVLSREDTTFIRYLGFDSSKVISQRGTFIQYHSNNRIDTVKTWGGSSVITSHISIRSIDSTFVLAEQKPLDSIFGKYEDVGYALGRPLRPKTIQESINMINNSNVKFYWIINKTTDDIYGPYSKDEFNHKINEINVSPELIDDFNKKIKR